MTPMHRHDHGRTACGGGQEADVTKPAGPDIADLADRLARLPLFGGLPAASLARLAARTQVRHYARGETVCRKGERPDGLYAVESGRLKEACRGQGGEEKILEVLDAGDICGEAALLADCPHPFPVMALSNTVLLHVDKAAVDALIDATPGFVDRLLLGLAGRQLSVLRDIEAYALLSPLQRVVGYLIDQCRAGEGEPPALVLAETKQVIASRLGMTPAAFSRTLRDLGEAGLIDMRGRRVQICDPARLEDFRR